MAKKIQTDHPAENAMQAVAECDARIAAWTLEEVEAVRSARTAVQKKQIKEGRQKCESERALLVNGLEAWAKGDIKNWDGKRSKKFAGGELGVRKPPPSVDLIKSISKNWEAALEKLQRFFPCYVRKISAIDKEAILKEAADFQGSEAGEFKKCGLKILQKEIFWIKSNAAKVLEAAIKKLKEA